MMRMRMTRMIRMIWTSACQREKDLRDDDEDGEDFDDDDRMDIN